MSDSRKRNYSDSPMVSNNLSPNKKNSKYVSVDYHEETSQRLEEWFETNPNRVFLSKKDIYDIEHLTGLSEDQIKDWFSGARQNNPMTYYNKVNLIQVNLKPQKKADPVIVISDDEDPSIQQKLADPVIIINDESKKQSSSSLNPDIFPKRHKTNPPVQDNIFNEPISVPGYDSLIRMIQSNPASNQPNPLSAGQIEENDYKLEANDYEDKKEMNEDQEFNAWLDQFCEETLEKIEEEKNKARKNLPKPQSQQESIVSPSSKISSSSNLTQRNPISFTGVTSSSNSKNEPNSSISQEVRSKPSPRMYQFKPTEQFKEMEKTQTSTNTKPSMQNKK